MVEVNTDLQITIRKFIVASIYQDEANLSESQEDSKSLSGKTQEIVSHLKKAGFTDQDIIVLEDPSHEEITEEFLKLNRSANGMNKIREKAFFGLYFVGHFDADWSGGFQIELWDGQKAHASEEMRALANNYCNVFSLCVYDSLDAPRNGPQISSMTPVTICSQAITTCQPIKRKA